MDQASVGAAVTGPERGLWLEYSCGVFSDPYVFEWCSSILGLFGSPLIYLLKFWCKYISMALQLILLEWGWCSEAASLKPSSCQTASGGPDWSSILPLLNILDDTARDLSGAPICILLPWDALSDVGGPAYAWDLVNSRSFQTKAVLYQPENATCLG